LADRRLDPAAGSPARRTDEGPTRSPGSTAGRSSTTCAAVCCPRQPGLLLASWLISSRAGWIATARGRRCNCSFSPWRSPSPGRPRAGDLKGSPSPRWAHDLLRVLVEAALLPYQAWLALDAIARVWYRRLISHRRLLEWTSAQAIHGGAQSKCPCSAFDGPGEPVQRARGVGGPALAAGQPWVAGPWLLLWFLSPLIGWLLSRRPQVKQPQFLLPAKGPAIPEKCGAAHLALFLGLCE
jgi:cyclic beta-1,2-glucan synthetase